MMAVCFICGGNAHLDPEFVGLVYPNLERFSCAGLGQPRKSIPGAVLFKGDDVDSCFLCDGFAVTFAGLRGQYQVPTNRQADHIVNAFAVDEQLAYTCVNVSRSCGGFDLEKVDFLCKDGQVNSLRFLASSG